MVTAFHPPSTQHINGTQAAKSESESPSREIWSWRCRRMSSFQTSPTNITSSTCGVTTCSLLDASQNTRSRMPTCWLPKQQCNRQLRRTLSSWPTLPIWSSCYATTQIQMASNCSCSVRHRDNDEEPHLGYQSHPKWVGWWHLQQHPVHTRDIWVWHHIQTILWSRKRIVAEEIHLQCVFQR